MVDKGQAIKAEYDRIIKVIDSVSSVEQGEAAQKMIMTFSKNHGGGYSTGSYTSSVFLDSVNLNDYLFRTLKKKGLHKKIMEGIGMSHIDEVVSKYTGRPEPLTESQKTDFEFVTKAIGKAKSEGDFKVASKFANDYVKKYGNPSFLQAVKTFLGGKPAETAEEMLDTFQKLIDLQAGVVNKEAQWKAYQKIKYELG